MFVYLLERRKFLYVRGISSDLVMVIKDVNKIYLLKYLLPVLLPAIQDKHSSVTNRTDKQSVAIKDKFLEYL